MCSIRGSVWDNGVKLTHVGMWTGDQQNELQAHLFYNNLGVMFEVTGSR